MDRLSSLTPDREAFLPLPPGGPYRAINARLGDPLQIVSP